MLQMLEENGTRTRPHRATIAHLQGGQCGNRIGNTCCDRMGSEHKLEANDQLKGKAEEGDNQKRLHKIDV